MFIAGSTPQVITETLYALAVKKPPVHPDEICIVTTLKGRKTVVDALMGQEVLKNFQDEYNLPAIPLSEKSFVVPVDASGTPLADIRNEEENEHMGDLITSFIREKTGDPAVRLHCSLAGGRKTMSFYIGAAMQLFGRPWDKLYHVLVNPEFESNPEFYYKPQKNQAIEGNGKRRNTRYARILLAELPFIRLRNKLTLNETGFRALVEEGQQEIDTAIVQPQLRASLSQRAVYIGEKAVRLAPMYLMIYIAYLRQKLNRCRYPERMYCLDCTECFPSLLEIATKPALEEMAKDYVIMHPSRVEELLYKYKSGLPVDVVRQSISKIRKAIKDEIADDSLAALYAITTSVRGYSNTRHGVRVEKGKIRIE